MLDQVHFSLQKDHITISFAWLYQSMNFLITLFFALEAKKIFVLDTSLSICQADKLFAKRLLFCCC